MSYQESVVPLRIKPRRSRILTGFIIFTHGGAVPLSLMSLPLWAGLVLSSGIVCSLVYTLNRHVLMHGRNAITDLIWDSNGDWRLLTRDGGNHDARLLKSSYLHARMVVLNFAVDGRNRSVILLSDSLDPETFRKLRVRMQLEQYRAEK